MTPEQSLRAALARDLSRYIDTIPNTNRRYINHAVVRAIAIAVRLRHDWHLDDVRETPSGWVVTGTLTVHWPYYEDGRTAYRTQSYTDISDFEESPASASSRLYTRCMAMATGLGLQAWDDRALPILQYPHRDTDGDDGSARYADRPHPTDGDGA